MSLLLKRNFSENANSVGQKHKGKGKDKLIEETY